MLINQNLHTPLLQATGYSVWFIISFGITSVKLLNLDKSFIPTELACELHRNHWKKGYGTEIGNKNSH